MVFPPESFDTFTRTTSYLDLDICFATLKTLFFPPGLSNSFRIFHLILSRPQTSLLTFYLASVHLSLLLTALVLYHILQCLFTSMVFAPSLFHHHHYISRRSF